MEVEVKAVPGIDSCFASLPLSLIYALQSTAAGPLPPVLALELRSRTGDFWNIAWSGSASRSNAIEVAQKLAECISLPDGTKVQVKAVANLPTAGEVSIEPSTEDDWEILELNSEHAEESILKQVGIVHEGMKFPLWLHGHVVVVFRVTSTSPKQSVVQLVPGTEVVVAPKTRKERVVGFEESHNQELMGEQVMSKALLRLQAENRMHIHWLEFNGVELGVVLTSVAFIHPETASRLSFDNLQLVTIVPRLPTNETTQKGKDNAQKRGSYSPNTEENKGLSATSNKRYRQIVVRILCSELVTKDHLMLPQSLRLFLKAKLHSWVYIKKYSTSPKKDMPSMRISPFWFKFSEENNSTGNDALDVGDQSPRADFDANVADWSLHYEILASIHDAFISNRKENKENALLYHTAQDRTFLIEAWLKGQLMAIGSHGGGMEIHSVVLTKETLFHFKVKNNGKNKSVSSDDLIKRSTSRESVSELLFLLTATLDEASPYALPCTYELASRIAMDDALHSWKPEDGKLEMGEPVFHECVRESSIHRDHMLTVSSLTWMEAAISDVINRLFVLLSPSSRKYQSTFGLPIPGHVLICGPSGSGKTSLATAVAKYFEEHDAILAHIVFVSCSKLALERSQTIQEAITHSVSEALVHAPSLLIFDDLDRIISLSSEAEGAQLNSSVTTLMKLFTDIMDEYAEKTLSSCAYGPIAFIASVQSLGNLPQALSSSGRFDFHVQLSAPKASKCGAILKQEICKHALHCSEGILTEIGSKCDGYDAYDLEILVGRAMSAAASRLRSNFSVNDEHGTITLVKEDFVQAMNDFVPVTMRGLTKSDYEGGRSGWSDVGGLREIRKAIEEMVELPSKFPDIFANAPLRLRSNLLLYGPPGCGKTHIVGAAAAACSLRFISIKGPELLNKYIGASEKAVRDLFAKAAAAAPCLLFFDEFDSIAPKRGHDNTGVTDRVVNQLLTELDGVEALNGVFVFAATSRPDLLDAALLRPGRLDRLLYCDFPTWQERLDILTVLSKKLTLASDIDLGMIASMTEGFSGADLQALLSDAQLASVNELVNNKNNKEHNMYEEKPVISDEVLRSVTSKARPSVSEAERHKLNAIYSQFLDSKKSATAQSREAKGKRATLA
ncbi:peroxin-1 protein [Dioscorea alata]|uniref:Peroxin-1 protein n=2 Tax=Dioscorea alata TaxID=55571 RepID=A0ACB7U2H5_DIOAL|nr:peroxin-1 protein [Dioscorea alata]KAH7654467.1 peroxin-1 protein [Dioscorea alata]